MLTNRLIPAAFIFIFLATPADGAAGLEADGEAQISDENLVQAKDAAVSAALKHCVEQVVGVLVQNRFSSEQQDTGVGDVHTFSQKVQDTVLTQSQGFIQSYDVLSQGRQGNIMRVRVRAVVFESKLQAEMQKIADLLAAAGNPRIMVILDEVYTEPAGGPPHIGEPMVAPLLSRALLSQGFVLQKPDVPVAPGVAPEALVAMARSQGADMLVFGHVDIHNAGPVSATDAGGFSALEGQVRVEVSAVLQGINTASGEVLSAKPVHLKTMGLTEERAVFRALQGQGDNVVKQLVDALVPDLRASLQRTAQTGQQYWVQLQGVQSYRQQGQIFLQLVSTISGVSGVTERSFENGSLAVDVMCKCSTSELQQGIFSAASRLEGLKGLDLANSSGKRLSFKL